MLARRCLRGKSCVCSAKRGIGVAKVTYYIHSEFVVLSVTWDVPV